MRLALRGVAAAALLAGLACGPQRPAPVYGPWVEGLTLAYEDPTLPGPQRFAERLQVRVARATVEPAGPHLVQLDLAGTRGGLSLLVRYQEGGIELVDEGGRVLARTLPVHFPETTTWTDRGTEFTVIGRAAWDGASILPPTSDSVGVWVESRSASGHRRRGLYLPDLGEVESRELRDGQWVVVNRLVARGFTDHPLSKRP
jgi:hypothetical protein